MEWFLIESWHIADPAAGRDRSHCGLDRGIRTLVAEPPGDEKTCEICLRHVAREADEAEKPAKAAKAAPVVIDQKGDA